MRPYVGIEMRRSALDFDSSWCIKIRYLAMFWPEATLLLDKPTRLCYFNLS